jgi:arylsulfatase A-like enzyme
MTGEEFKAAEDKEDESDGAPDSEAELLRKMMERRRQEVGEAEKITEEITQLTKQWSIVHTTKDWNYLKRMFKRILIQIWFISACSLIAADRPNIIFILCDDLGPGDIGVLWQNQREGKQRFATPNLDQFANEGMILTRHYCPAPVCAPSRGSLLTGRHQGHCGIRNTQFDKELPDEHTLGTVMQQAGYATAAIGKWGLQGGKYRLKWPGQRGDRSPKLEPGHPLLRGFDYFYGYTGHVDGHYHYPLKGNRPMYDGYKDVTDDLAKCYTTDLFTARTKKWIVEHRKAHPKQPFFTYLAYDTPHAPQQVPTTSHLTAESNYPEGGGLTSGVQWNEDGKGGQINTAKGLVDQGMHPAFANRVGEEGQAWPDHAIRHATMIRRIGDAVVDIVQLLKDLDIDKSTLIVFSSDNGTHFEDKHRPDYFDTFGPYDGRKRDMWEGGVRMPTLVRWPSVITAGSKSDSPSQFHDWMATFCDLADVQSPALSDGVSIAPTLTGREKQRLGIVYSEYLQKRGKTADYKEFEPSRRGRPQGQMQSILIGDYKGIRVNLENHQSVFEVYHTLDDLKEATDLAGKAGVPTQQQFQAAVLRTRRIDPAAPRPYDNELIPALAKRTTRPGLIRKEYPGQFPWVPQFDQRQSSGQVVVDGLHATPGAQQFIGYLRVPKSGVYHFALTTKGKAVVRLHDALLIGADSQYKAGSKVLSGKIALQVGLHPLRINYLAGKRAGALSLEWQVPGGEMKAIPISHYCITPYMNGFPPPAANPKVKTKIELVKNAQGFLIRSEMSYQEALDHVARYLEDTYLKKLREHYPKQKDVQVKVGKNPSAEGLLIHENLIYALWEKRAMVLDLYLPAKHDGPLPVVIWVHGGGWQWGSHRTYRSAAMKLAKRGFATVCVEYRLAGEATFPAAVYDVRRHDAMDQEE